MAANQIQQLYRVSLFTVGGQGRLLAERALQFLACPAQVGLWEQQRAQTGFPPDIKSKTDTLVSAGREPLPHPTRP